MFSNKNTIIIVIFCLSMLSENFAYTYSPSADKETWYYYDTPTKKYYKVTTDSYDTVNDAKTKCNNNYSTRTYKLGGNYVTKYTCIPSSTNKISNPELINTSNVFCKSNTCKTLTSISKNDGSNFTLSGENRKYNNIEYFSTFTCNYC